MPPHMVLYNLIHFWYLDMWRPIKGYEGIYSVSSFGEIASHERISAKGQPLKERILKPRTESTGYKFVTLFKDCIGKNYKIHRLVAMNFIDNPGDKPCVNHINGDKSDNAVENLEWVTHGENKSHSFKALGEKHWMKGLKRGDCPYSKKVCQIDMNTGATIKVHDSAKGAFLDTGVSQGNLSSVARGERKHAGGFFWRYLDD